MTHLISVAILVSITSAGFGAGSRPLEFTAQEVNPVIYYFQRDHYCTPYALAPEKVGNRRYIGDQAGAQTPHLTGVPLRLREKNKVDPAHKAGITGMWTPEPNGCNLVKQQTDFYDSVWRDAVRLETIVNYKIYFGPDLANTIDLSDYAIDDGVVSQPMMRLLTTDTTSTFGAQNDDVMWWALAFLRAYEYNPSHQAYLKAATAVFKRIQHTPEQQVCGGGITWGEGTHYKNAITNALYLALATRLAQFAPLHSEERRVYLAAAVAQADWLLDKSGLLIAGGVLGDGVHFEGTACSGKLETTVWTYSQGVAVSGLAELTLLSGATKYADRAQMLLLRGLNGAQSPHLVNQSGILDEPSTTPATANEDAQVFKGIFVQHLGYAIAFFREADPKRYGSAIAAGTSFLSINANAVWRMRHTEHGSIEFPFDWTGASPASAGPVNMRTTGAAIDLLNAAWSVRELR